MEEKTTLGARTADALIERNHQALFLFFLFGRENTLPVIDNLDVDITAEAARHYSILHPNELRYTPRLNGGH